MTKTIMPLLLILTLSNAYAGEPEPYYTTCSIINGDEKSPFTACTLMTSANAFSASTEITVHDHDKIFYVLESDEGVYINDKKATSTAAHFSQDKRDVATCVIAIEDSSGVCYQQ